MPREAFITRTTLKQNCFAVALESRTSTAMVHYVPLNDNNLRHIVHNPPWHAFCFKAYVRGTPKLLKNGIL